MRTVSTGRPWPNGTHHVPLLGEVSVGVAGRERPGRHGAETGDLTRPPANAPATDV